jgi:hypothetical protein
VIGTTKIHIPITEKLNIPKNGPQLPLLEAPKLWAAGSRAILHHTNISYCKVGRNKSLSSLGVGQFSDDDDMQTSNAT